MTVRLSSAACLVCILTVVTIQANEPVPATPDEPRFRIAFATLIGGSADEQVREVIPSPDGTILIGGQSLSADLPVTPGALQARYGGEPAGTGHHGVVGGDSFLARLSGDGRRILSATYFGGSKQERNVYGMALDRNGDIVITTATRSPDLPTTTGSFQPKYGGPPTDWAVAKLSADLKKLRWSTYVGGSGDDFPRGGLDLDTKDNIYVVGRTASADFPTTPGVIMQRQVQKQPDAAVVKLKPDGSDLVWSTRLGGSKWDSIMGIRMDTAGRVLVAGHTRSADFPVTREAAQDRIGGQWDGFVACLAPDASRVIWATFLGGSGNEFAEHRPLLMPDGSFVVTGTVGSGDFPTTPGAVQQVRKSSKGTGFVTRVSPDGKRFVFSTYLGGSGGEEFWLMPTLDHDGNIVVVGRTASKDLPVTADALQPSFAGGAHDGAVVILSPDGSKIIYATYLGGSGDDLIRSIAVDQDGALILVGNTDSRDFPLTEGTAQTKPAGGHDGFLVKLAPDGQ